MEPTVEVRRNFLFGGYKLSYANAFELEPGSLSLLVDEFFSKLVPQLVEVNGKAEILDFKGRDSGEILDAALPPPRKDELFSMHGEIAVGKTDDGFEWDSFAVEGRAEFQRFEGSHHIVHSLEVERQGALPAWVPLPLLGRIAPVEPTSFRFALQHFRSSIFSVSLGYTPSVVESLLVDASATQLSMKFTTDSKTRDVSSVLEDIPLLEHTFEALGKVTGVDVASDLVRSLRKQ